MTDDSSGDDTAPVAKPDFARRRTRARWRRRRPLLIGIAVVVLAALLGWLLYFSSLLAVTSVDVTGNTTVGTARIEKAAAVPIGEQLVRVDLAAIQARVETIPAIKSVTVSRSWPHGIAIDVTERQPIAVVSTGTLRQLLDSEGKLFPRYGRPLTGLPLVKTPPDVNAAALLEAARVIQAIRPDIAARVKQVDVETVDKISLELSGGITVLWGSAVDSDNKAQVLEILLKKHVRTIDVSVPGRPTTS